MPENSQPVAVIVGGAGGIGRPTVRAFASAGYQVVSFARHSAQFDRPGIVEMKLDALDEDAVAKGLATAAQLGPITRLVTLAGGSTPGEERAQAEGKMADAAAVVESLERNYLPQYIPLSLAVPHLAASAGQGLDSSVTLVSSASAFGGWGEPLYSSFKAALHGLCGALAPRLGRAGIRINVVAPSAVPTEAHARMTEEPEAHFALLATTSLLDRLPSPEEVADVIFAVANLTYLTGQIVRADGGAFLHHGLRPPKPVGQTVDPKTAV